jgi:hypothetical protein
MFFQKGEFCSHKLRQTEDLHHLAPNFFARWFMAREKYAPPTRTGFVSIFANLSEVVPSSSDITWNSFLLQVCDGKAETRA